MVPLPAAQARRDRLCGQVAHLYKPKFYVIHELLTFGLHDYDDTRLFQKKCFLTIPKITIAASQNRYETALRHTFAKPCMHREDIPPLRW